MDWMGFEGKAYVGTAGSPGATELVNSRDISYGLDPERGDTTRRGNGSVPPMKTSRVTARVAAIEITMLNNDTDTALASMKDAAYSGGPIAIRLKDHTAGKGFDGDCTMSCSHPYPLAGEQVVTFSCEPTAEAGRQPVPYV